MKNKIDLIFDDEYLDLIALELDIGATERDAMCIIMGHYIANQHPSDLLDLKIKSQDLYERYKKHYAKSI